MGRRLPQLGALFYLLWGVVHVAGGALMLDAALSGVVRFVQFQAGDTNPLLADDPIWGSPFGLTTASGVFAFHSFNLIWLGLLVGVMAVCMNWRNSTGGYWLSMALVGCTDLGLLLFIVRPGILSISDAWIGPGLFVLALIFSTLGRLSVPQRDRPG